MEETKGTPILYYPFERFKKVYNLLEYDGPILAHYKDERDKDYIFFWVDDDENYNRWLIFPVSGFLLMDYLHKRATLLELVEEAGAIYITDVDESVQYNNIRLLTFNELPEEYLPEKNSYYRLSLPSVYESDNTLPNKDMLYGMRRNGISFSLKPTSSKYNQAVKAGDAGEFLINIKDSAQEYAKIDFFNKYKSDFSDPEALNRVLANVIKTAEPYVADAGFSSFEVLLSIDVINPFFGETVAYKDWRRTLLEKYYEEVINIDYTSDDSMRALEERFPDDISRKKIVKPIADILLNKDYRLVTQKNEANKTTHKQISKERHKQILTTKPKEDIDPVIKKKLIKITYVATERDGEIIFSSKEIERNLLSRTEESEIILSVGFLNYKEIEITLKEPIQFRFFIDDQNLNHIICEDFGIDIFSGSKPAVMREFQKLLIDSIAQMYNEGGKSEIFTKYVEEIRDTSADLDEI